MSKSLRYDFLIPLFGRNDDKRVRLFLDILFDTKLAPWNNNAEILKGKNFEGGQEGENVSNEWNIFFSDIKYRLANYNSSMGVDVVKSIAAMPPTPMKMFAVQLVRALFVVPEDAGQWSMVSAVAPIANFASSPLLGPSSAGSSDSGRTFFNYKLDKYVISVFLEAAARNAAAGSQTFFNEKKQAEIYRKPGLPGLYTVIDNKEVEIHKGSAGYNAQIAKDPACQTTGFKGDCTRYITQCLEGNDIKQCADFLQNPNFWQLMPEEVNKMLPAIAVNTLLKFKFDIIVDNGNKYVETTKAWISKLKNQGLSSDQVQRIANNGPLIAYLDALVAKINLNMGILNPGITKGVGPVEYERLFKDNTLYQTGMRPMFVNTLLPVGLVQRFHDQLQSENKFFALKLGIPYGGRTTPVMFAVQNGGAHGNICDLPPKAASTFNAFYNLILAKLQKAGKTLAVDDQVKIKQLLTDLEDKEAKLHKTVCYADKYFTLLEVFEQKDDNPILSMDAVQRFVDARNKYFTRTVKKQDDIASILQSLLESTMPTKMAVVANNGVPAVY